MIALPQDGLQNQCPSLQLYLNEIPRVVEGQEVVNLVRFEGESPDTALASIHYVCTAGDLLETSCHCHCQVARPHILPDFI